jgi:phenylalanyl-tRNA synthetase alpha chain
MASGPEAETEFYNFTAMNIPETHPSRLESDTLYLDYGEKEGDVLLRTHTSPMQARYMEQHDPPVYVVVPGKVFRSDAIDSTHSPVFHQIEGLAVDKNITFGDLKGTLATFAREFLGKDTKVKFIPHYFPFTEPSAEMHAYSNGRWIELLGCGMVNPAVFDHVGYDPSAVTGFAFGMGPERLAIIRHGITDIHGNNDLRPLLDPDQRILRQYLSNSHFRGSKTSSTCQQPIPTCSSKRSKASDMRSRIGTRSNQPSPVLSSERSWRSQPIRTRTRSD